MDLNKALNISAAGMDAQTMRLRVIAENLANQDTTGSTPGADAYRRKTISFENRVDASTGVATVRVKQVGQDTAEQTLRYDPSNPAAMPTATSRRQTSTASSRSWTCARRSVRTAPTSRCCRPPAAC